MSTEAGNRSPRQVGVAKTWIGLALLGLMAGANLVGVEQTLDAPRDRPIGVSDAARKEIVLTEAPLVFGFAADPRTRDGSFQFVMRGTRYALRVTPTEAMLALSVRGAATDVTSMTPVPAGSAVLRMTLLEADPHASARPLEELPGKVHDLVGPEPHRWRRNVSTYAKVKFVDIYPGVDVVYYDSRGRLEYDFIVAPGADPSRIAMGFPSAERLELDSEGNLQLRVDGAQVLLEKPRIYQEIAGIRRQVEGGYVVEKDKRCGFDVSSYDKAYPLVIDPVVSYASYLGGSGAESPFGDVIGPEAVVGPDGSLYIAGFTQSLDFPTASPIQPELNGRFDAFVAKLDPTGSTLLFSTYFGGSQFEAARGIAVSGDGRIHVAGYTNSSDFPVTPGVVRPAFGGVMDAFAATLDPTGFAIVFATYLGGSAFDVAFGVGADAAGNTYVAGRTFSNNFPIANALQPAKAGELDVDAFVAKLNPSGTVLVYSSYLGGSGDDAVFGLTVDAPGNLYLVGRTYSPNFPSTAGAFDEACGGDGACDGSSDAFVVKMPPSGSPLAYSTYLGGAQNDWGFAIDIDGSGNAYVTGYTASSDFPVSAHAAQPVLRGFADSFVSKIDPAGSKLMYATYLGGRSLENLHVGTDLLSFQGLSAIAVDPDGNAFVTGLTYSQDFPIVNGFQPFPAGGADTFVAMLDPMGSSINYSSYLGGRGDDVGTGLDLDADGSLYIVGATASADFPTKAPLQGVYGGEPFDVFFAKLNFPLSVRIVLPADTYSPGDDLPLTMKLDNRTAQPEPVALAVFLDIPSAGTAMILGPESIALPPENVIRFAANVALPADAPSGLWKIWALIAQQTPEGMNVVDVYGRGFVVE